jgi:hypothetical protein
MIIDGGSFANVISSDLVNALSLSTWRLPTPRYMQWMNQSGTLKITHKARVKFSVGSYIDTVDCDIAPVSACHLWLGRSWQFDLDATHSGHSNTYSFVHKGVQHVLKPMLESAIKAEIFGPSKVKKRFAEITPKLRTTLFQEGESDVINPVSITTANCSQGVLVMDSVVCEIKCKVSETAVDMRVSEGLAATKPIEFYSATQVTHDAPVMASTAPEIDSNVSDGTAADPLKYYAIQFGCFSDKKVENEDNMAVIGGIASSIKEALEFMSKPRTALFKE